jgi:hypothetical protein
MGEQSQTKVDMRSRKDAEGLGALGYRSRMPNPSLVLELEPSTAFVTHSYLILVTGISIERQNNSTYIIT